MKITVTPKEIRFAYPLFDIKTSGKKMEYFFTPKKRSKIKFNINIDPFDVNVSFLKIVLGDKKINSFLGKWFGYLAFFLNKMLFVMNKDSLVDLDLIAMESCEYDVCIFGEGKIRSFFKELESNGYQVNDVMEKLESLSNKNIKV